MMNGNGIPLRARLADSIGLLTGDNFFFYIKIQTMFIQDLKLLHHVFLFVPF